MENALCQLQISKNFGFLIAAAPTSDSPQLGDPTGLETPFAVNGNPAVARGGFPRSDLRFRIAVSDILTAG
jgi:hypothetical protein